MKKTAIVLVGLASSTAAASAGPRLAAQESGASRASAPAPRDDYDAWLEANYGPTTADGSRASTATTVPTVPGASQTAVDVAASENERRGALRDHSNDAIARAERFLEVATRTVGNLDRVAMQLLGPKAVEKKTATRPPISYPRVDQYGDMACGNVATKGGSKRVCTDRSGMELPIATLELE